MGLTGFIGSVRCEVTRSMSSVAGGTVFRSTLGVLAGGALDSGRIEIVSTEPFVQGAVYEVGFRLAPEAEQPTAGEPESAKAELAAIDDSQGETAAAG